MRGFSKYALFALGMAVFEARMAMALDMDNVIQQVLGTDDGDDAATDALVQHAATGMGMKSDDVDDLLGDDKPMKDDSPYKGLFGSEDGPTSTVGESYSPMPQTTAIPTATGSSAAKPTSIGPYSNSTSTHNHTRPGSTPAVASKTGSADACEPTAGPTPTGRYRSKANETCKLVFVAYGISLTFSRSWW
ncbi:hypothetical protein BDZ85DRAFT_14504 [Elsinoe ampelina]|uniref:Uncharacterized protein n=1 Tax=Elsinoe ampelina TaxID=302913 RepID=A0A6A6G6S4_9PEZI|nr:hypothetical protein BDZ85DRAFT_14504 [Elsinoe ampelina]